jgi:hypothetical protein
MIMRGMETPPTIVRGNSLILFSIGWTADHVRRRFAAVLQGFPFRRYNGLQALRPRGTFTESGMSREPDRYRPMSRTEGCFEELLVRVAVGIFTGLAAIMIIPIVPLGLGGWQWFAGLGGIGFVIGFVGGDIARRRESAGRRKPRR